MAPSGLYARLCHAFLVFVFVSSRGQLILLLNVYIEAIWYLLCMSTVLLQFLIVIITTLKLRHVERPLITDRQFQWTGNGH